MTNPETLRAITTKLSHRSVEETVAKLTELVTARGMTVFASIDQAEAARSVGLHLRPTTLVIFGNPAAGTAVMEAVPLSALDLPLKILVWADGVETKVSYVAPRTIAARYALNADLAAKLAGIDALTDSLVSA